MLSTARISILTLQMIEPFKLETINVTEKLSGQDPSVPFNVTSFSSFTEENSEI